MAANWIVPVCVSVIVVVGYLIMKNKEEEKKNIEHKYKQEIDRLALNQARLEDKQAMLVKHQLNDTIVSYPPYPYGPYDYNYGNVYPYLRGRIGGWGRGWRGHRGPRR